MELKRNFLFIFFFIAYISFSKSLHLINMTNKNSFTDNYNDNDIFKFQVINVREFKYIKIIVTGKQDNHDIRQIISFYQEDESFKERKQLSQSLTDENIMWLNNNQIKNNFYFSVECTETPCDIELSLIKFEIPRLSLNEQYSYFVSEENVKMEFEFFYSKYPSKLPKPLTINIWVKGNQELSSELELESKYGGHDGTFQNRKVNSYNIYRILFEDYIPNNLVYSLNINSTIGDFINIGFIIFDSFSSPSINDIYGLDISGYLSSSEEVIFLSRINNININYNVYENERIYFSELNNGIKVSFVDNDENNSAIYSLQFINNKKHENQGNNIYYPQSDGIYYYKTIEQGTSIGLIPMKPNDNFKTISYEVLPIEGEISVYIFKCENYPLCQINEETIKKSTKITGFKSFHHTFNKNDYSKTISPISKEQNMLLISCENKLNQNCYLYVNMKTDSEEVAISGFMKKNPPYSRLILKDLSDKYFFKGKENHKIYLYIEKFSGQIEININPNEKFEKYEIENKLLYIIPENKNISVTIKAKKNSIYLIYDNYYLIDDSFKIGSNYLLLLKDKLTLNELDNENEISSSINKYYFSVKPLNCSINFVGGDIINEKINKNVFYQNIFSKDKIGNFQFIKEENNDDICLLQLSAFKLEEVTSENLGIPLGNNSWQSFKFDDENYIAAFSYPYLKNDNDILIDFDVSKDINYNLLIYINNIKIEKEVKINSKNAHIKDLKEEISKKCSELCKITLLLELEDREKEDILKIKIEQSKKNNDDDDDDDDDDVNTILIIFLCIGVVLIGIGIFAAMIIIKTKKGGKDLNEQVNQISFKKNRDDDDDDDSVGDTLLE